VRISQWLQFLVRRGVSVSSREQLREEDLKSKRHKPMAEEMKDKRRTIMKKKISLKHLQESN